MDNTEITFSVVVPTHNRADALAQTLFHLSKQEFSQNWEVVVVNNNSTDDTDAVVESRREMFPVSLRLIHEKTPGAAAARNSGARAARGKYLIFIDNDILTPIDFLSRHLNALEKFPGSWIAGRAKNLPEQQNTIFGRYIKSLYSPSAAEDDSSAIKETNEMTAANVSMRREQFDGLGGFDENFHVASGEDRELALRAVEAGIKILFDPQNVVLHDDWAGTSIRDYCKRQQIYTQTEPFFWRKYGDRTPRFEMVKKNLPPELKRDGLKLFAWKNVKRILGGDLGQSAVINLCEISERVLPDSAVSRRLYRLAVAGAIYRGFQEGLEREQNRK